MRHAAHPALRMQGCEEEVVGAVRAAYLELLIRHASGRVLTNQARAQLKLACLAIATYR